MEIHAFSIIQTMISFRMFKNDRMFDEMYWKCAVCTLPHRRLRFEKPSIRQSVSGGYVKSGLF